MVIERLATGLPYIEALGNGAIPAADGRMENIAAVIADSVFPLPACDDLCRNIERGDPPVPVNGKDAISDRVENQLVLQGDRIVSERSARSQWVAFRIKYRGDSDGDRNIVSIVIGYIAVLVDNIAGFSVFGLHDRAGGYAVCAKKELIAGTADNFCLIQPVIFSAPELKEVMMPLASKVTTPSATALMIRSLLMDSVMSLKVSTPPIIRFSLSISGVALILTGKEVHLFW